MENPLTAKKLTLLVISRAGLGFALIGSMFFLSAGSLNYWQAWAYMACLFFPMVGIFFYLIKNDPLLLERRMHYKEPTKGQNLIIWITLPIYLSIFILPGLDRRFGWSHLPVWLCILGLILVMLGYAMFFLVMKENSYASRVVEVMAGQKVISSGPYAIVRHPMYAGVGLLYMATPLALGSGWSLLPALLVLPGLAARILNEEKLLIKDLPGYQEYTERVRFRIFPGIW